ncbi:MAG: CocE/NonD family hydrolase, partial [Thermodesulfobacteriota bacterium]
MTQRSPLHLRRFRTLALVALLALHQVSLTACGNSSSASGGPSPSPTAAPTPGPGTVPASYSARGSVEQAYVVDAEPGSELTLVDGFGAAVATGTADAQGSLIFRDVPAGGGYRVTAPAAGQTAVSEPFAVTTAEDVPDPSFYQSQVVGPGYQYIETRDGTLLAINVLLPGPVEDGPYPTVIEYSGYSPADPDSPQPSSLIAAALGYAVVGVNMRGTGCSGGAFQFFETLQSTDGYDAVEIVAAQPWVAHGKVGMVGLSYPGISQLFVARLQPPGLAAIAPLSVIADTGRGVLYPGGILNNGFATAWAEERQREARPGGQAWSQRRMDAGDEVCVANQRLRDQSPDIIQMINDNNFYYPELADPVTPALFVDRIEVPVFLAGAWQDEQTGSYFANMLDRFGSDQVHFTMTNGGHTEPLAPPIFGRWMEFLDLYVARRVPQRSPVVPVILDVINDSVWQVDAELMLEPDRFADVSSYEEALARFESEPPVRILFDNGAGGAIGGPFPAFEASFDAWPVPDLVPTAWYFDEGGRLVPEPPADEGVDSWLYDPSSSQRTSLATPGTEWRALPDWDWQPLPDGRAVAYATDELAEDVLMAGSGSVDLWLSSTAADTDLQVTLSEIRPDGFETYVQSGWLRASRRATSDESTELRPVHTHREDDAAPLPPGELALARVELFPFAHAFRAGSRIRISVEAPGGDRALWKFEALPADGEVINTVARGGATASRVVLPVLPGLEAIGPLPACPALRAQPCRPYEEV